MFQTVHLECHQQRSFTLGELTALPRPLAGLRDLLLRGGERKGAEKGQGRGRTLGPHNVGDRLTPLELCCFHMPNRK